MVGDGKAGMVVSLVEVGGVVVVMMVVVMVGRLVVVAEGSTVQVLVGAGKVRQVEGTGSSGTGERKTPAFALMSFLPLVR